MNVLKSFRYRLDLKPDQLSMVQKFSGCRRYIFNRFLFEREEAFRLLGSNSDKKEQKAFSQEWSYVGMAKKITRLRSELPWLKECPVHALQNAAKDLQKSYDDWFSGDAGKPLFKKKSDLGDSWRESDRALIGVNGNSVKLPKIGWVSARISKKFTGSLRQATVKKYADGWYVSLLSNAEMRPPENTNPAVGLDLGVVKAVTQSDGKSYEFGDVPASDSWRIKHYQRSLSRKVNGSKNRSKARLRLSRLYGKISRRTRHEIHVMTCRLAKNHSLIGMEKLDVKDMARSASGTTLFPGKNVAAKSALNRQILSRCWGEIRRQLEYKCVWYGSRLVLVPAEYSSRQCSACGIVSSENRKTRGSFSCISCGHAENADVNAAKVILKRALAAGHAVTACGEDVRRRIEHAASVKQEPTQEAQKCAV